MGSRHLTSGLVALALVAAVPAEAGGTIGVTITAETGDGHRAISRFLSLYAGASAAAKVVQRGTGNAAAIGQSGRGNRAVIAQTGRGHSGTVTQTGRDNRFGLFQFGEATDVAVTQTGRRGATLMFVGGW